MAGTGYPLETQKRTAKKRSYLRPLLLSLLLVAGLGLVLFLAWYVYFIHNLSFARPPRVQAIALGDLNGNGYLDAYLAVSGGFHSWHSYSAWPDRVLSNNGHGRFNRGSFVLPDSAAVSVGLNAALADVNGNGRLDVVACCGFRVWLNDGSGRFEVGQQIDYEADEAIAVGDVTGDGTADIFVAGVDSYQVWRGQGNGRFTADRRTDFR